LKTICFLKEIGRGDTPTVGGKAAALGELLNAGFNVPDGFVLTTHAYVQIIQALRERIDSRVTADAINDPAQIESLAGEVREWIEIEPWPADLHAELGTALAASGSGGISPSFAARTSLPSDELATAFGSGVQRATLGLAGVENVKRGAARCWGALWTSRSMYYRQRKKIPQTQVSLAVLIQPMIKADSAGTIFTQNPLTNDRDEMQIDSIWGLGAPLTQARVKPDRFVFSKADLTIVGRQIEEKTVRLAVTGEGGLEQQVVAPGDITAQSLTDRQVVTLAEIAGRIEDFFGEPQRIEWARLGEQFYVLQARPMALRTS
jgi:phosphoenolpyruvate synthase/pyruvate phosphate dikinase